MTDTKIQSNGMLDVWWVPGSGLADPSSPTAAELNGPGALRLSPAVAWDGSTWPNATDTNTVDDRGIEDAGNTVTAGYEQYEATLSFFYPKDLTNTTSDYVQVFEAMRTRGVVGHLVTRVLQRAKAPAVTPAADGDWVSVFKVISDSVPTDTEGEDSYKYYVTFQPQGGVHIYTQVKTTLPTVVTPATLSGAVGSYGILRATLGTKSITQGATWTSSDNTIATVSPNGVVTYVATGTATIEATHPADNGTAGSSAITVA